MIRTAILGASGYVGGELLRLIAAHPELARREAVRRQQGGAGARRGPSASRARLIRMRSIEQFDDGALDGVDLVFAALAARAQPAARGAILDQRHPVRRSRRRLPARRRGDLRALVRPGARGAGAARRVRLRHSRAQPRRDPRREGGRRRRLLRDRGDPRAEAAGRRRAGQAGQPRSSMPPRASAAPAASQGSDRLQHGRRQLRRLRPAQPPPHGRDGDGAGRRRCCSRRTSRR